MSIISIIIPCYNSANFLSETIDHLLELTTKGIELVFINDGSTDMTLDILLAAKERLSAFFDVKIIDKKNEGVELGVKDAFKVATGDYFFMMGHDDFLSSRAFDQALEAFDSDKEIDAVRMVLNFIDSKGNIIKKMADNRVLPGREAVIETIGWHIHTFSVWKRSIFRLITDLDTGGLMNFDEYLTRYFYANCRKVGYCDGEYFYLQHSNSVTKKPSLRKLDPIKTDLYIREFLISENLYKECAHKFEAECLYSIINGWRILKSNKTIGATEYARYKALIRNGFDALNKRQYLKNQTGIKRIIYLTLLLNFPVFLKGISILDSINMIRRRKSARSLKIE